MGLMVGNCKYWGEEGKAFHPPSSFRAYGRGTTAINTTAMKSR